MLLKSEIFRILKIKSLADAVAEMMALVSIKYCDCSIHHDFDLHDFEDH